jgi:hypothetical protein
VSFSALVTFSVGADGGEVREDRKIERHDFSHDILGYEPGPFDVPGRRGVTLRRGFRAVRE